MMSENIVCHSVLDVMVRYSMVSIVRKGKIWHEMVWWK